MSPAPPSPTPPIPRWLLLAHQLPTRPSHGRVKTWRRLQQLGAVPTRNSVYVLPNTPQCREDYEWLRAEIVAAGGEATVFAAESLAADGDVAIENAFRQARDADYAALIREAKPLLRTTRPTRGQSTVSREPLTKAIRLLRERFSDIERIDFGRATGRDAVVAALESLERHLADTAPAAGVPAVATLPASTFRKRRWVTRPRPGVDRMASAWLIRRFIDPGARFAFVSQPATADVPFDMFTGDFRHQGPLCTFEVLVRTFGLGRPAVDQIARIVHDLDLKDTQYSAPEGPAVDRMVDGLRRLYSDDHTLLEQGITMFEALARSFDIGDGTPPARRRARRHSSTTPRQVPR